MAEPFRVPHRRSMLALKRKIVVRAESLKARLAFVSTGPAPQLFADIMNLLPQEPRRSITTARLQLDNGRCHLDHAGVEIDRPAGRQLERASSARQHLVPDQFLSGPEDLFR